MFLKEVTLQFSTPDYTILIGLLFCSIYSIQTNEFKQFTII